MITYFPSLVLQSNMVPAVSFRKRYCGVIILFLLFCFLIFYSLIDADQMQTSYLQDYGKLCFSHYFVVACVKIKSIFCSLLGCPMPSGCRVCAQNDGIFVLNFWVAI